MQKPKPLSLAGRKAPVDQKSSRKAEISLFSNELVANRVLFIALGTQNGIRRRLRKLPPFVSSDPGWHAYLAYFVERSVVRFILFSA